MAYRAQIKYANAVFEGGGVKGIGLAGALVAAEEDGFRWVNVAGTSAGAVIASLIAVGYSGEEIRDMLFKIDYSVFQDRTMLGSMPYIGLLLSVIKYKGIFKGDMIEGWLREKYRKKGKEKFGDIIMLRGDEPLRYKLRVIATDITRKRLVILPQDIKKYGIEPGELDIAKAVRMSISLPFFFTPVVLKYGNKYDMKKSMIVDGGLLSNFPVWLFDSKYGRCPTIGFKLVEPVQREADEDMNTVRYILNIISTMSEAFDERYIEESKFRRTIMIPTMGVGTTEFNISKERSMRLYQSGYEAAKKFLKVYSYSRNAGGI